MDKQGNLHIDKVVGDLSGTLPDSGWCQKIPKSLSKIEILPFLRTVKPDLCIAHEV